ncbi:4'-phosphopantetheinyl transferase superfamily protein [Marinobacter sp. CHS3-4]|uniref:4'-phosphopantetheinyl transferase family protein n=1 Tax=Marinobacter sp. CHS3-4 TaxID=3045174 RepID=UPI0024B49F5D|nr:4'-phosphopantetheinyl transferase superfamily protein [Marinobacter sp. CHS3-4]MDI9243665.1 4'-phosphopantetheinyl transferase superfamily protein [Marinobacter sp. CHS3-4]
MSATATGGPLNASSPESAPAVWLCASTFEPAFAPFWLTEEESQKLCRLNHQSGREFLASRWLVRRALAEASGQPAERCCPAPGKVRASSQPPGWQLSISHSQGLAGCAIYGGSAIGLDLEPLTRRPRWRKVSARWFAPTEHTWLLEANDDQAFLKVWTLKEAWLKATGRGIADNLQTLSVGRNFSLTGDRPGEAWQASLGHCGEHLVAVVYQGDQPPNGHRIALPEFSDTFDDGADDRQIAVEWYFHTPIHCQTYSNP